MRGTWAAYDLVMVEIPEVRYAWNGDVALAYQVFGDGPIDMVYLQGFASHVVLNWEGPALSRFLRELASHARLIVMDRRGWGCSDRFSPFDIAPLETMTDDLLRVMDAAGSERAVLFGTQELGITTSMFAATYPERSRGLILCDAFAAYDPPEVDGKSPWGDAEWDRIIHGIREGWGRASWVADWKDRREAEWFTRYASSVVAPGALIAELRRYRFTDPRAIYPTIHVPTLVLATTGGDGLYISENGHYLAGAIPGARLVQHDIVDGPMFLHWYHRGPAIVAEVGRFLASIRQEEASFDRVLATVLFTDIVDSTATAAVLGDAKWRKLIDEHDRTTKALVARYRGEYVHSTGDGLLATFDGPARAVRCAQAIIESGRPLGVEIRAGLHTGEVERAEHGVAGVGVHIGARVGAMAGAGEVWVTSTVKDLVAGSGLAFEDRGEHQLKGVPDHWHLYRVARS